MRRILRCWGPSVAANTLMLGPVATRVSPGMHCSLCQRFVLIHGHDGKRYLRAARPPSPPSLVASYSFVASSEELLVFFSSLLRRANQPQRYVTNPTIRATSTAPPTAAPIMAPRGGPELAWPCVPCAVSRKIWASASISLSLAGRRFCWGHFPVSQGFVDAQHPMNGGWAPEHVYHVLFPDGAAQFWAGILVYESEEKLDGLRCSVGHSPMPLPHGSTVQQPMKRVAALSQM